MISRDETVRLDKGFKSSLKWETRRLVSQGWTAKRSNDDRPASDIWISNASRQPLSTRFAEVAGTGSRNERGGDHDHHA